MKTLRLLLLAGAALVAAEPLQAAPIPTSPIYTNKLKFRIPFHYDQSELQRLQAREIRLYVSRDRGRNWKQVQAVAPDAGKFNFQAAADGEYWFIVRTLDAKNRLHPEGNTNEPGLQVIVDTTAPRLQLELKQLAAGKVQLSWTASDDHLDVTQLRLEYIQPGAGEWQPVSVVPKAVGQTEWAIPQGGLVAVRGSVSDFAHNVANDQTQLRVAPGNQAVPRPASPDGRQPVAGPAERSPSESLARTMPEEFPSADSKPEAAPRVAANDVPAADKTSEPVAIRPKNAAAAKSSLVSHRPEVHPRGDESRASKARVDASENPAAAASEAAPPGKSGTGRVRTIRSRRFQLGYKLQDVESTEVERIELYITDDAGKTWYRYGSDDDKQSPVRVEVPKEGEYGFALGVITTAGPATDPPARGDAPPIVVIVDETPPQVELLPPDYGRGRGNKLLLRWRVRDDHPAEKPIALYYSTTGNAPWQPISGWIEDTESYIWTIASGVPSRIYLRIEARDAAGNIQSAESEHPVSLDLARPTAKIIDIESLEGEVVPKE